MIRGGVPAEPPLFIESDERGPDHEARSQALHRRRIVAGGPPLQADPVLLGQVHDRLGRGLPGAQVELIPIHKGYEQGLLRLEGRNPAAVAKTETDALGRFRLASSAPGVFSVRVTTAGRVPLAFEPLPLVEETELPPALLLEDAGAPLVVRHATGRPAAGVWVFAESEEDVLLPGGWRIAPRVGRTSTDGSIAIPRPGP